MEKQKNVPALRFSGFEDEWVNEKISTVFSISAGGDIASENVSQTKTDEFRYPIYANAEKDKGFYAYANIFKAEEGTITVAGRGVNIGIAHFRDHKYYPIVRLLVLRPKVDISNKFYTYAINNLNILLESTGVPQLTAPQFSKYEISFPEPIEQQKIASFLTAVDDKIQQLSKKKTLLEKYKKGLMQQIFSREIRFKNEGGNEYQDWEEKKLGDLCKVAKSGGTPTSTKVEYYDGNIPFLSISDMTKQGKYLTYTSNHISKLGLDNSASWILPIDTIIYSMYASVGFVSINKIELATSQAVLNLILKSEVNTEFMYYSLVQFQDKTTRYITTGTQGNLNAQTVKAFKLHIPCLDEQTKIANFLSAIDDKINLVNRQLKQTRQYKKGLLQQMFV